MTKKITSWRVCLVCVDLNISNRYLRYVHVVRDEMRRIQADMWRRRWRRRCRGKENTLPQVESRRIEKNRPVLHILLLLHVMLHVATNCDFYSFSLYQRIIIIIIIIITQHIQNNTVFYDDNNNNKNGDLRNKTWFYSTWSRRSTFVDIYIHFEYNRQF